MPSTQNPADTADNIIRLTGLTDAECRSIAAEGELLLDQGKAERVVSGAKRDGIASVSIWGDRGRHFIVHRRLGEVFLIGLHGRVLARSRRFDTVLYTLRSYTRPQGRHATR